MPRIRKKDKHLPPNVYYIDYTQLRKKKRRVDMREKGVYIFMPYIMVNGKKKRKNITLGHTYPKAMAKWIELTSPAGRCDKLMSNIFDAYLIEVAPKKAPQTYRQNIIEISNLRPFFCEMQVDEITPADIYEYMDMRGQTAKVRANREKALLSHIFSFAIKKGLLTQNPCREVKGFSEKPRKRYVEDWEFLALREWSGTPPLIKAIMGLMYVGGRRRCELLNINKGSDILDEGIKIYDPKGKEWFILEWTEDLKLIYQEFLALKRKIGSIYLIANRSGKPYTGAGLRSIFYRTVQRAIAANVIKEPFNMHDIRAKASSDALNEQEATALLKHTDSKVTVKHYRRKMKRVKAKQNTLLAQGNANSTINSANG